jgi:hypothetical protein
MSIDPNPHMFSLHTRVHERDISLGGHRQLLAHVVTHALAYLLGAALKRLNAPEWVCCICLQRVTLSHRHSTQGRHRRIRSPSRYAPSGSWRAIADAERFGSRTTEEVEARRLDPL